MRKLALLLMASMPLLAHTPGCAWNCSGIPVRAYPRVVVRNGGVSTGAAVASAIAAGILGWELGRHQSQPKPTAKQTPAPAAEDNCKIVKIDDEQRLVCRDNQGNWQIR